MMDDHPTCPNLKANARDLRRSRSCAQRALAFDHCHHWLPEISAPSLSELGLLTSWALQRLSTSLCDLRVPPEPTVPPAAPNVRTRKSTTKRRSQRCDATSARQACFSDVVLHEDILLLCSAQDVAKTLCLVRAFVPHSKRLTRRFELVHVVTMPIQQEDQIQRKSAPRPEMSMQVRLHTQVLRDRPIAIVPEHEIK